MDEKCFECGKKLSDTPWWEGIACDCMAPGCKNSLCAACSKSNPSCSINHRTYSVEYNVDGRHFTRVEEAVVDGK